MRTDIVIDDKLTDNALKLTGLRKKREVTELSLKTLLKTARQANVKRLSGTIAWESGLDVMRHGK